jgi:ribonuclease E
MSNNRMLIDASHPEETRVVVQRGNRIDEFDFESASRKQLRGNIYLAKVTRVEPSLQAAFIEYGGNRHGFLAFSEIHPDYYQIPVADRMALLEEEARFAEESEGAGQDGERRSRDDGERNGDRQGRGRRGRRRRGPSPRRAEGSEAVSADAPEGEAAEAVDAAEADEAEEAAVEAAAHRGSGEIAESPGDEEEAAAEPEEQVEQIGGGGSGDALEDMREQRRQFRPRRQYKIQEVIKRRQILLVQVVKEERGNKGAALTTYLSLAGRYSVLMPNTPRGGGISRKITNSTDRKRLKELATALEVPDGMGVILRTAGANRTQPEIKRDFEYLLRVWEQVRETTLNSVAPTLVYEEGSLIKRSIRDLFGKEVDEVQVAGESGYQEARAFMKMLMPSQVKAIKAYREPQPLFVRYGVESQLDAMFSNTVTLKSGGYIVINPTEALVSIDVNSGRSTREHNIEDTALRTNLEAAEEVSRQLRLRDLAGLIVIDFIDMEEHRNNRTVEKRLKDCLKNDRARIQVGRISAFGLMEMSRQRMRTGVLESSTLPCPHCGGSGFVRATSSVALLVLRAVEEALLKNAQYHVSVTTRTEVALYILNQKRLTLRAIEERFGVTVAVLADDSLHGTNYYTLERGEPAPEGGLRTEPAQVEEADDEVFEDEIVDETASEGAEADGDAGAERGEDDGRRGRRRRRRRGGRDREFRREDEGATASAEPAEAATDGDSDEADGEEADTASDAEGDREGRRGRRRRGRRGGRRGRREDGSLEPQAEAGEEAGEQPAEVAAEIPAVEPVIEVDAVEPEPAPRKRSRKKAAAAEADQAAVIAAPVDTPAATPAEPEAKPKRGRAKKAAAAVEDAAPAVAEPAPVAEVKAAAPEPEPEPEVEDPNRPKRTGWWSRAKNALTGG